MTISRVNVDLSHFHRVDYSRLISNLPTRPIAVFVRRRTHTVLIQVRSIIYNNEGDMTPQRNVTQRSASSASLSSSTEANGKSPTSGADALEESSAASTCRFYDSFYFLSDSAARALPEFQYKGQDLSLTYKYLLSPFAEWCVQTLTPRTIAPNTITLIGLVFMIAAYASMWYHVPMLLFVPENTDANAETDMDSIPRWVFLFNAMAILIYQTLDNMDGKQARRVGASSPLGLLFDHGCDAVNSVFGSANWMVALALSSSSRDITLCFTMLMGPYALFYVSTWEEYYTGQLIMPIMNGPNEGLLGAVLMSLVSYWCGPSYWHTDSWWSSTVGPVLTAAFGGGGRVGSFTLRNADMLVIASGFGMIQELTLKTVEVARTYGRRALLNQLPFLTLVSCSVIVGITDMKVWLDMPRTSLHLCAVLFVEMTMELMLKHMTKQAYQPFRWILFPLVAFTVAVATGNWPTTGTASSSSGSGALSTADFLLLYSGAAGAFLLTKTVVLIHEICFVLNIWCFDIVTPRRQRSVLPTTTMSNVVQNTKAE